MHITARPEFGLTREQVHITACPEFGLSSVGRMVFIVHAMYGLKSSGAAWHATLSETLHRMNFLPSYADLDVLMHTAVSQMAVLSTINTY